MNLLNQLSGNKENQNDLFWVFDGSKHFRPKIQKGRFFTFTGYDFTWLLLQPLFSFIGNRSQELEKSRSFSYAQKALYFCWQLDAQIASGGFVQFYFNGYGTYMPTILKGLDYIGDKKMISLLKRVDKIFLNKKSLIEDLREQHISSTEVYEMLDELALFNDKYFELNQRMLSLLEKYIRGHPHEICLDEDGNEFDVNYTGLCNTYYDNNNVKEEFNLKNGLINGEFKSFYQNGNLKEKILYSNGKQSVERKEFHENGKLKYEVVRGLDKKTITHRKYYENGKLTEVSTYNLNNLRSGDWLAYYEDGSPMIEAEYVNGECLLINHWNREGDLILKDGTGLYVSEAKVERVEQEFKNYKKHGKQKTYLNGILSLYQEMVKGKAHGVTRNYYENGNIEKEVVYENGNIISSKDFPKFKNPKVKTTIVSNLCKQCYTDAEKYMLPDNTPKPLNIEALENNINAEVSLLKAYNDDYILNYSYIVYVGIDGNVTHIKLSISGNMIMAEDIEINLKKLKYQVALKNGMPIEGIYTVHHLFQLVES